MKFLGYLAPQYLKTFIKFHIFISLIFKDNPYTVKPLNRGRLRVLKGLSVI